MERGFALKRTPPPMNPLNPIRRPPPPKTQVHIFLEDLDRALRRAHQSQRRVQYEGDWHREAQRLANAQLDRRESKVVKVQRGASLNAPSSSGSSMDCDDADAPVAGDACGYASFYTVISTKVSRHLTLSSWTRRMPRLYCRWKLQCKQRKRQWRRWWREF